MNRAVALCSLIVAGGVLVAVSLLSPGHLSDQNGFLKSFVGPDMLSFLGVTVTITLASAANLHLELNRLETAAGKAAFPKTRSAIKQSAHWLLAALFAAVVLLVSKQWAVGTLRLEALVNSAALLIVLINILVLIDISQIVFRIDADLPG